MIGPLRAAALVLTFVFGSPAGAEEPIVGRASVIDGDTIEIAGERIRFNGIDAPESWQRCLNKAGTDYRCGRVSAEALDAFLALSRPTRCTFVSRDRYRRYVGDCYRADGKSVAVWLVRQGYALDWPRYSKGKYAADQDFARSSNLGLWQGSFVEPWNARQMK